MSPKRFEHSERIDRACDIIEQVGVLNELLDRHRELGADRANTEQYEYRKEEYLKELNEILLDFRLIVMDADKAAGFQNSRISKFV